MDNRPSYAETSRRLEALEQEHQRLKRSHARLEALFEGARHPIGIYDGDGVLLMMNASGAANLGGRPQDYIGRSLKEMFPDRAEVYIGRIRKAIASHGSEVESDVDVYEDEVLLPAGPRWFSSTYKVIDDGGGGILGVQVISLDITEQKATQSTLTWNQRLLSIITDRIPAFVAYVGPDRRYRFVNKKFEDFSGRPKSDFTNRHIRSFLGERYDQEIKPFVEKALAGRSVSFEMWLRSEISAPIWVEASYVPDMDDKGSLRGFVVMAHDRTDRKRIEDALRRSEEKFRALVESSSEHIFLLAPDGTYLMSNERTAHFDLPPGTALAGKRIDEVYPPEVAAVYRKNLGRVLASGRAVDFEHSMDGGGAEVHHLDTLFPVFKDGGVWCVGGICRDITRLKKTERRLKKSEQRYRSLIGDMPNPMVRLRPDGVRTFVNESYCSIFGKSAEELIGGRIWDRMPAEDQERVRGHIDSLRNRKSAGLITEKLILPNNETRWFRWVDRPFFDADGALAEIQAIGWDVTEERRAHEALTLYAERLGLLRDVDREILQVKPPEEIAAGAVQRMRRLIPSRWVCIQVRDPESGESEILAVEGGLPGVLTPGTRYPAGFFIAADTLVQGMIHAVADLTVVAAPTALEKALRAAGIRAFVCIPLLIQETYIGSVNFGFDAPTTLGPEQVEIAREAADSVAIAIHNAWLYQESERQRLELQALARRLTEAEEIQRKTISQEMHDRLGPNLTSLSINLGLIGNLLGIEQTKDVSDRVLDSQELVAETARQMRNLMAELRPPALDDYGVTAALEAYAELFQARTGIAVAVTGGEAFPRQDPTLETALFRVAQEGLTNAAKHAHAKNVRVAFGAFPDKIRMTIADDGGGFDPASTLSRKEVPGWGLVSMQERVSAFCGRLEIYARPGEGTRLEIEINIEG